MSAEEKVSFKPETVSATNAGWSLRLSSEETGIEVWEKPDGSLYAHHGDKPLMLTVIKWFR